MKKIIQKIKNKIKSKYNRLNKKFEEKWAEMKIAEKFIFIFFTMMFVEIIVSLSLTVVSSQLKEEEKLTKVIEFKNKDFLNSIENIKIAQYENTRSVYLLYNDKNDTENIKQTELITLSALEDNYMPIFVENDISWTMKKSAIIFDEFILLSFLKEDPFRFIMIVVILLLMDLQGMFNNKDKYKIVNENDIKTDIDELIGMDDIKAEILQLSDMLSNMKKYKDFGLENTFNILFSGPPGTGKTKIATALAKRLGVPIIIGTGNVETGYINGGANVLKELWREAEKEAKKHKSKTVIIFLDEAQTLMMKRGQQREKWGDDSANELLALLDGVNTIKDFNIIFIAASNFDDKNHQFDEAMMRRFKKKIFFRKPNVEERVDILKLYVSKVKEENREEFIDYQYLAEITANLSPAILETIVQESSLLAITHNEKLSTGLLEKGFERIIIGLTDRKTSKNKEKTRKIIAKHELGHFIVSYQLKLNEVIKELGVNDFNKLEYDRKEEVIKEVKNRMDTLKISIESVAQINALGYVLSKDNDNLLQSRKDLEEEIMSLYGGVAAESVFFGEDNISTGSSNDIEKVSKIMDTMINKLGMYNKQKINFYHIDKIKNDENNQKLLLEKSEKFYSETEKIIQDNKEMIEFLSNILLKKYILTLNEVFEEIKQFYKLSK